METVNSPLINYIALRSGVFSGFMLDSRDYLRDIFGDVSRSLLVATKLCNGDDVIVFKPFNITIFRTAPHISPTRSIVR
jgi:hypothetical protein